MMDEFNERVEGLRNSVRSDYTLCILASLHLEIARAEAAADYGAAIQGYQWMLMKLFPREFGDSPRCKCQKPVRRPWHCFR